LAPELHSVSAAELQPSEHASHAAASAEHGADSLEADPAGGQQPVGAQLLPSDSAQQAQDAEATDEASLDDLRGILAGLGHHAPTALGADLPDMGHPRGADNSPVSGCSSSDAGHSTAEAPPAGRSDSPAASEASRSLRDSLQSILSIFSPSNSQHGSPLVPQPHDNDQQLLHDSMDGPLPVDQNSHRRTREQVHNSCCC
jgi:hypothetical protein